MYISQILKFEGKSPQNMLKIFLERYQGKALDHIIHEGQKSQTNHILNKSDRLPQQF